jgi:hypothetical protein
MAVFDVAGAAVAGARNKFRVPGCALENIG